MKYLKTYEDKIKEFTRKLKNEKDPNKIQSIIDDIEKDLFNNSDIKFEINQVYNADGMDFCYLGVNGEDKFKNVCMLLKKSHDGRFEIITWNDWFKSIAKPLNMDFLDYIIKNKLFQTAEKSLKRMKFSSKPLPRERKIAYEFRDNVFNDERYKMLKNIIDYNV